MVLITTEQTKGLNRDFCKESSPFMQTDVQSTVSLLLLVNNCGFVVVFSLVQNFILKKSIKWKELTPAPFC